jgi:hypothetical protein
LAPQAVGESATQPVTPGQVWVSPTHWQLPETQAEFDPQALPQAPQLVVVSKRDSQPAALVQSP